MVSGIFQLRWCLNGGLFCSALVAALYALTNVRVEFAVDLRDLLLVVFFSTVGRRGTVSLPVQ